MSQKRLKGMPKSIGYTRSQSETEKHIVAKGMRLSSRARADGFFTGPTAAQRSQGQRLPENALRRRFYTGFAAASSSRIFRRKPNVAARRAVTLGVPGHWGWDRFIAAHPAIHHAGECSTHDGREPK